VATILWIPLIVTGAILTIRFGIIHTLSAKYLEFKTTFILESTIQYPDVELYSRNTPQSITCFQFSDHTRSNPMTPSVGQGCTQKPADVTFSCTYFNLSTYTAAWNPDPYGSPVLCFMEFPANPGQNEEMYLITPGGFNTSSKWNQQPTYLRPNFRIGIDLFKEIFFGFDMVVTNWFTDHHYESSIFPDGSTPYNVSLGFRVPLGAIEVDWMSDGFDGWFLIATWGGGFFFFYVLFLAAFNIVKFFMVNDSRLARSNVEWFGAPSGSM